MKINFLTIAALTVLGATSVKAQLHVGGTTAPDGGSILKVSGGGTKGFLAPQVALTDTLTAAPVVTPAAGLLVYNTGTNGANVIPGYYYYNGAKWVRLTTGDVDLKNVGNGNHLSNDAGIGTNGTNAGAGGYNVGIGQGALAANTQSHTIAIGWGALTKNTIGSQNLAIGSSALGNNVDGGNNTALGYFALNGNTSGGANMAFGYNALGSNQTGNSNLALGYNTLNQNISGAGNVGIGQGALGSSLNSENTAIGTSAMYTVTNGGYNTSLGSNSGNNITTGSRNIAIGYNTQLASATTDYQLNIGNSIFGTGLSGTLGSPAGNIGIGTAAPAYKLDVRGQGIGLDNTAASAASFLELKSGPVATLANVRLQSNVGSGYVGTNTAHDFQIYSNSLPRISATSAGNVGIGTTAPTASAVLQVSSTNKGILMPQVALLSATDVATIPSPATSLMIYNTATAGSGTSAVTPGYYYYNGSIWASLVSTTINNIGSSKSYSTGLLAGGSTSPTFTVASSGVYRVELTTGNGCGERMYVSFVCNFDGSYPNAIAQSGFYLGLGGTAYTFTQVSSTTSKAAVSHGVCADGNSSATSNDVSITILGGTTFSVKSEAVSGTTRTWTAIVTRIS